MDTTNHKINASDRVTEAQAPPPTFQEREMIRKVTNL